MPPAFRSTTELVQINVIVTDKNGPVEGLTKEDFVIYDEYKKRDIAFFAAHSRRTVRPAQRVQPVAPGEFTNVSEGAGPEDPNAVMIVWDLLNTRFPDQVLAKEAVLKSLSVVRPCDHVGIYILGTQFTVIQDFTSDSSQLAATLERYTRKPDLWGGAGELVKFGSHVAPDTIMMLANARIKAAVRELLGLITRVSGRKSVIWISEAPPNEDYLWKFTFPLYMVDAKGLRAVTEVMPDKDADRMPKMKTRDDEKGQRPQPLPPGVGFSHVPRVMQKVAEMTGGRAFVNSNDIRGAIEQAFADSDVTYTLGFYPRLSERESSEYHNLKVTVKRRGVSVRHPEYYATKPAAPSLEELMSAALTNDLGYTQLRLAAKVERDGAGLRVPIAIASTGVLQDNGSGRFNTRVDYLVAQRAANSDVLGLVSKSVMLSQDAAQHERYMREGLHLTEALTPKAGLASIRIVVRDQSSGAIGTLTIPVSAVSEGATATAMSEKGEPMPPSRVPDSSAVDPPAVANTKPKSEGPHAPPAALTRPQEDQPAGAGLSEDPLIRRAAEAAGEVSGALPNYICREAIARSESVNGGGRWRPLNKIEADLILEDGKEAYRNITVNGLTSGKMMEDLNGTRSTGEFATLMRMLFSPSTGAEFRFAGVSPSPGSKRASIRFPSGGSAPDGLCI